MNDRTIRTLTALTVLMVAAIAAIVSYQHLYHLAITHGETRLDASLLPLSIDGTVVTGSLLMLRAARLGLGTPWLARVMLALAVTMTVAANVAYGWRYAWWGILMAGWPAAAFLLNAEGSISFGRKARGGPQEVPADPAEQLPLAEFTDAMGAAEVAYRRSLAGGNPYKPYGLATAFGIPRPKAAEIVTRVAAESNGHAPEGGE